MNSQHEGITTSQYFFLFFFLNMSTNTISKTVKIKEVLRCSRQVNDIIDQKREKNKV